MESGCYYLRNPDWVTVTSGDGVAFIGPEDEKLYHRTASATRWSHLMQKLANPAAGASVLEGSGGGVSDGDLGFLDALVEGGAILEDREMRALEVRRDRVFSANTGFHMVPSDTALRHLVVACTGSIVAGLVAPTILSLCYSGFQTDLDIVLTESALSFVSRDLFESYGIRTWVDAFEKRDGTYVPHVHLGRSADCILVLPASANSLHRLAVGACTDLLSMIVTATTAPVVVAPVMNNVMLNNRAVQRNLDTLRGDGIFVIEPTLIFGAADLAAKGQPMYGGHGTLWSGPLSLMRTLSQVRRWHEERPHDGP